ncbi:MAG: pentapeptide repeat-containing protein [Microcoleaceae cyanobacterium]
MAKRWLKDFWTLLNTDVRELGLTGETVIEGTTSLIDLAGTLNEHQADLPQLAAVIESVEPVIKILDSPMIAVVKDILPFGSIGISVLKACLQATQKDPTLSDCVVIVGQAAYLESFQYILNHLENSEENIALKQAAGNLKLKVLMKAQSQRLKELDLDQNTAKTTINSFHNSPLAEALGNALTELFPNEDATAIFIERVARNTHYYIYETIASSADDIKPLAELFRMGGTKKLEQLNSIEKYLQREIKTQPQTQVFNEAKDGKKLSIDDIYVSMKAKTVDKNGDSTGEMAFDLANWATEILNNLYLNTHKQVIFIQGEPGHGKSVFCRMYSDWVRRNLYPNWIPILIRLRDIQLQTQFRETLRQALISYDFAANDDGWLTDDNIRYLFLLDGFDELVLSQQDGKGLEKFLDNVATFQREEGKNHRHRILITGRPMALQGYEYSLPHNLNRVSIVPMDDDLQNQWLSRWQEYAGEAETEKLRSLIHNENCPKELQKLAREPLLLYLLAILARSDQFNPNVFNETKGIAVKIQIYTNLIDSVLEQQRTDRETGKNINEKLTGFKPKKLRRLLSELALCITQTETERASVTAIKQVLDEKSEKAIDDLAKDNILAAFYLKTETNTDKGSIEFIHKSFREFLTAERLQRSLKEWTDVRWDEDEEEEEPTIKNKELYQQIYDLLGYGILTKEIVEYLIELLKQRECFNFGVLAQRLQKFYLKWADGDFIEQITETLPQKKAQQLQEQKIEKGQRQVDIYTGLNIMILLLELHRYGKTLEDDSLKTQLSFHPCGVKDTGNRDDERLLKVINYSNSIDEFPFDILLRQYFSHADLSYADLSYADLSYANLSHAHLSLADLSYANLSYANLSLADLSHAHLSHAHLSHAHLSDAILSHAILSHAILRGADLSYADLSDANLSHTNLSHTNLSHTNLSDVNLRSAKLFQTNLSNIRWRNTTLWDSAYHLYTAINIPDNLAEDLSFRAAVSLSQGYDLAQAGEIEAALQAYKKAQEINPTLFIDLPFWQQLCWHGCLHGMAEKVLFAGEKAIELQEDDKPIDLREDHLEISCLESRGLARALTNNLTGALEDFQAAQKVSGCYYIVNDRRYRMGSEAKQQRQKWITALEAGINPFTPEELEALRQAEKRG